MSQGDLATQMRMTQTQISRIEHGRPITLEEAVTVARVLGVDIGTILNDTTDTEASALQQQQDEATREIAVRRVRVVALQVEITELQRQIAYYEIVVHTTEQRMADLTDAYDEDNDEDDGYEEL